MFTYLIMAIDIVVSVVFMIAFAFIKDGGKLFTLALIALLLMNMYGMYTLAR